MKRRLHALVLCAAIAGSTAVARAQESDPALIVIVGEHGAPFGLRLAAELEVLGFRAAIVDPTAEPASRGSLEAAAREAGAIAAIRAVPSEHGVEIWLTDRVTGKTLLRELTDAGPDEGAAALRTVELLRASLAEVALAQPTRGEVPEPAGLRERLELPAPDAQPAEALAPALHVGMAPGVALSPGGFAAAATLGLGLDWMPSDHVGLVALGVLPITGARASAAEGTAELSSFVAGAGLRVAFASPTSRWAPSIDAGFAAVWIRAAATASAGYSATEASSSTGAAFLRAGLGVALGSRLRLRADVLAASVGRGVTVRFAGREVATWGEPLVVPSLGAELGFF